jgi:hypothetical protein
MINIRCSAPQFLLGYGAPACGRQAAPLRTSTTFFYKYYRDAVAFRFLQLKSTNFSSSKEEWISVKNEPENELVKKT